MKLKIAFAGMLLSIGTTGFTMQRTLKTLPKATVLARGLAHSLPKYENRVEIFKCWDSHPIFPDLSLTLYNENQKLQDIITNCNNQGWELTDIRLTKADRNLLYWILQFKRERQEKTNI